MHSSTTEKVSSHNHNSLDINKWRSLVEGWDGAKENQKSYCKRLGISLNTFSYVRGKLKQKAKVNSAFIPVLVSPSEKPIEQDSHLLTLENRKGLKLHISPTLSIENLVKILKLCGWQHD